MSDMRSSFPSAAVSLVVSLALFLSVVPAKGQGTEADVFVAQAVLAYEDKRYGEALQLLQEALKIEPQNIDALYYTGLVMMAKKQFREAIEPLENARKRAASDLSIVYQLGVAYFSLEQYDKAEPLLTEVFNQKPQTESAGYYVGFMRYRHKDYQGAITAFESGATTDPNVMQLTRFYKGLALAIIGLPERAASELEEAKRIRTVSPLTGPADRLRDTLMAAREGEKRLRGEVRFGAYYDTNVTVNPLSSTDALAQSLRSRKSNTPGELASVHLEYSWARTGPWEATMGYSFFQTVNNDITAFNLRNHLGSMSGFYRGVVGAMPFQIGLRGAFDSTTIRDNQFMYRTSVDLFATLVENERNLTTFLFRFQNKDFNNQFLITGIPDENRDANNYMAGFIHVFRFAGDKHLIRIGYQYDTDDAEGSNWAYFGHRGSFGAQYTLPWGDTRLKYDFDFHFRKYPSPNSLFPIASPGSLSQEVKEQNHVFRVEKPLPNNFTLAFDYQATFSNANIPVIFNYNRQIFTMSLSWVY